jgi:hypothetical protein
VEASSCRKYPVTVEKLVYAASAEAASRDNAVAADNRDGVNIMKTGAKSKDCEVDFGN